MGYFKVGFEAGKKVLTGGKKKSKTKLAGTWQDRRIDAINRKIKRYPGSKQFISENYAQEAEDIYRSKATTKKEYKKGKK
tara:strand:+ start:248 stop:487 length:240 start_codon:yes stop_codon:yes gene_type:complete